MDLRLASLTLGTLLILVTSGPRPSIGQKVYTNTWAVHITGGEQEASRIAEKHGFVNQGKVFGDYYHFRHRRVVKRSLSEHRGTHIRLHTEPQVMWAEQQVVKRRTKRDIYYEPSDPKFAQQWYLYNEEHRDLNVKEAWKQGFTGQGVVVSILDDGIEKNHPDLIQNYDPDASYDVNDGDPDPQPRYTQLNDNRAAVSIKVFGDYYHFRHRRVVKRSLSEHRGTHIRLHTEPQRGLKSPSCNMAAAPRSISSNGLQEQSDFPRDGKSTPLSGVQ
ncbi:furin-like [Garra rufa]|uniref:furin-like n=1 Tax=Garra rufa TaxID=137080 RepID=UPI003CCE95BA